MYWLKLKFYTSTHWNIENSFIKVNYFFSNKMILKYLHYKWFNSCLPLFDIIFLISSHFRWFFFYDDVRGVDKLRMENAKQLSKLWLTLAQELFAVSSYYYYYLFYLSLYFALLKYRLWKQTRDTIYLLDNSNVRHRDVYTS